MKPVFNLLLAKGYISENKSKGNRVFLTNERMFSKTGDEILSVINAIPVPSDDSGNKDLVIPSSLHPVWEMVKEGKTLGEIASAKNVSETVVSMQIEELSGIDPSINYEAILTPSRYKLIQAKYREGFVELKTLKDKLGEGFSYPEIRVFLAQFKFREPLHGKGSKLH
ncbi:MAG: hypothetical protein HBSAPP04_07930 [Ignavibacteriaceae bacterium]|nr:MAG: hypothetical protein HBSAPP04_07930 [Ignavibacteriaceae bacterium]